MNYADQKIVKTSLFLKVEQGTPHTIRLLDVEPTEQWQHNINQKFVLCTGENCVACGGGHSKAQRFVTNCFDHSDSRVYLWSYGPTVAQAIKELAISLAKDGSDILDHDLEISAKGSGMQKKTSVQLRLKSQPVPGGLKLHQVKTASDLPF